MADETGHQPGEEFNPYRAPLARVDGEASGGPQSSAGEPTELMVRHLRGTGPWSLFLAIMGFIGAGFMLLSGVSAIVMMPFMEAAQPQGGEFYASGIFAFVGAFYLMGGASYGVASYFLARYSQSIARVNESGSLADVERALASQHRFWRATGLIAIGAALLSVLFVVGATAYMVSMVSGFAAP